MPFPRDANFTQTGDSRIGNGVWDRTTYWSINHELKSPPAGSENWTRFQTYMWELGYDDPMNDELDTNAPPPNLVDNFPDPRGGESASPICNTPAGPPSRRVIYVAKLNCVEDEIRGNSVLESVPRSFLKFFLTEPSSNGEIFAEFIREVRPNDDDGILRQIVQLIE